MFLKRVLSGRLSAHCGGPSYLSASRYDLDSSTLTSAAIRRTYLVRSMSHRLSSSCLVWGEMELSKGGWSQMRR